MAGPIVLGNPADTWTNAKTGYTTKNYGSTSVLRVKTDPGETRRSWVYFALPFPLGCTIVNATLKFHTLDDWEAGVVVRVQKANAAWAVNKITDSNKPSVMGPEMTAGPHNWAKHAEVAIDVTAALQEVANGGAWYGFRVMADGTNPKEMASSQNATAWLRPTLTITWVDAPRPPTFLSPGGNRALATGKPILVFDYTDPSADSPLNACQIQIDPAGNWSAPAWDSGEIGTSIPQVDLNATSYPGLAPDTGTYWRVRVKDAGGLWSGWSHIVNGQGAQFRYVAQGVITITNPQDVVQATNLIPNPDVEVDTTGWGSNSANLTLSRDVGVQHSGSASLKSTTTTTAGGEAFFITFNGGPGDHAYSAWTKGPVGGSIRVFAVAQPSNTITADETFPFTGDWQRVTLQTTASAPGDTANHYIAFQPQQVGDMWVDDVTVVTGDIPMDFNGDTVDVGPTTYAWTGAAHESTSTKSLAAVYDPTPPFSWTFSLVQRHWQVLIVDPQNTSAILHSSGKISGPDTTYSPPVSVMKDVGKQYRVIVRIWDTTDREQNGGTPVYAETYKDFEYDFDGTVQPVTSFVAALDPVVPKVSLTWERASIPDFYAIVRDGQVIDYVTGASLQTGPTSYRYDDFTAGGRQLHTWNVRPIVDGMWNDSPQVSHYLRVEYPWLFRTDGSDPVALYNPKRDMSLRNNQELHDVAGQHPPVLITQVLGGFAGHVEGLIVDDIIPGVTAQEMRDNFKRIRDDAGSPMQLMLVDESYLIVPYNMTYSPDPVATGLGYKVAFDWVAVDY